MKKERQKISQTEVLTWLQTNHPQLHAAAEIERDWVWLAVDLRGEANTPIREAIKAYGFIFNRKGGHPLPSGKLGTWGHSCMRPLRFVKGNRKPDPNGEAKASQDQSDALTDEQILAAFGN